VKFGIQFQNQVIPPACIDQNQVIPPAPINDSENGGRGLW